MWRVVRARHAARCLDGSGARRSGGRWNPPGAGMVYTAGSLSLAVLETLAHVQADTAPDDLVAIPIEIPNDAAVETLRERDLPADWRASPPPAGLRAIGARWLRAGRTVALRVPSAVVPQEHLLLLSPSHRDIARVRAGHPVPFALDPRLAPGHRAGS